MVPRLIPVYRATSVTFSRFSPNMRDRWHLITEKGLWEEKTTISISKGVAIGQFVHKVIFLRSNRPLNALLDLQNTPMPQTYPTTQELFDRIKYDPRTIRDCLKDSVLLEGVHYIRPFGGRKIVSGHSRPFWTSAAY